MSKRAILSVYDKSGLVELGQNLVELGYTLIASGGTARQLTEAGIAVTAVEAVTNAPEMLGGRVKTLHPAIHGGILARDIPSDQADLSTHHIEMFDLVICNLYPFEETIAQPNVTLAEAIEQIDIGGVTLLRAAAKNFARVTAVCDPTDYPSLIQALKNGSIPANARQQFAIKAFTHTRDYDTAIVAYLQNL